MLPKAISLQVGLVRHDHPHRRFQMPFAGLVTFTQLFHPFRLPFGRCYTSQSLYGCLKSAAYERSIPVSVYVIFADLGPVIPMPRHLPLPGLQALHPVIPTPFALILWAPVSLRFRGEGNQTNGVCCWNPVFLHIEDCLGNSVYKNGPVKPGQEISVIVFWFDRLEFPNSTLSH
ncbi:unnamed protein product [Protopolystoma xenopodis]|uniref:Uncharacterized protein n=1 Tax=Protopolystoma xenopodis TaxID=117903 RepID=A0A448WJY5_9PLAT|nr:unnamed protein product [Protopolystoma xenopodis]